MESARLAEGREPASHLLTSLPWLSAAPALSPVPPGSRRRPGAARCRVRLCAIVRRARRKR